MLEQLVQKVLAYQPKADIALLEKAYHRAYEAHRGQTRANGEPYFQHPYEVCLILCSLHMDIPTLCAGLLHDTVEDVEDMTREVIIREFGEEIATLVDSVTKLEKIEFATRQEQQVESLRKMLVATARDFRVVIIKMADRLHNMRTIGFLSPERQQRIAQETRDIYSALAHRLGMFAIKTEFEDMCMRVLEPVMYQQLTDLLTSKRAEMEAWLDETAERMREMLQRKNLTADIQGRPKQIYSVYRKMQFQNRPLEEIYDLIALRIIVDSIEQCYLVLGYLHAEWHPMIDRFKDYIANPKPNGYKSLHTTLLGPTGVPFEVQIRTWEMHRIAEYGVAAHWLYKENARIGTFDQKLSWLRQMVDTQDEMDDPNDFINAMKMDILADEVLVYTPKGTIVELPAEATPIDFAYRIHSQVGDKCVGAKVSGRVVPLDTPLKTGDVVEIMTLSSSKGPSRDWLKIAKTPQARAKIKAWFKRELKEENIEKGHDMLAYEAKRQGFHLPELLKPDVLDAVFKRYSILGLDDLYAAVGFGGLSTVQVINRLLDEPRKQQREKAKREAQEATAERKAEAREKGKESGSGSQGVFVKGQANMMVRFARCCSPVQGDAIIGYITQGRGVSVHRADCSNLKDPLLDTNRLIEVSWNADAKASYPVEIGLVSYDRPGIIADLSNMFLSMDVPLLGINARVTKEKTNVINVIVEIKDKAQLERILRNLQRDSDIIEVYRGNS